MPRMYHVSPSRNRDSIRAHGLDWAYMVPPGIAGSHQAERAGIFLSAGQFDSEFFVRMAREPVDLWAVDDVDQNALLPNGSGFYYLPATIPADRLELVREAVAPVRDRGDESGVAYRSTLTVTYDDES